MMNHNLEVALDFLLTMHAIKGIIFPKFHQANKTL